MSPPHFSAIANWHSHIHKHAVSAEMHDWLTNPKSLTLRLAARCERFRVQRLQQQIAPCLYDEFHAIGLPTRTKAMERNVLLRCDEAPVVYAHTVLPLSATGTQWPLFATLGHKSLGSILFQDPQITRGRLEYAQLHVTHPLMRRIFNLRLVKAGTNSLFARRSLFTRRGSSLLVTEVFLPALSTLRPARHNSAAPCDARFI